MSNAGLYEDLGGMNSPCESVMCESGPAKKTAESLIREALNLYTECGVRASWSMLLN